MQAVLASLVDSLVDLASQGVVASTEWQSKVGGCAASLATCCLKPHATCAHAVLRARMCTCTKVMHVLELLMNTRTRCMHMFPTPVLTHARAHAHTRHTPT